MALKSVINHLETCTPTEAANDLFPILDIVMANVLPHVIARDPKQTGGWFAFWRIDQASGLTTPVLGFAVGSVEPERFEKYLRFANEKASRLGRYPEHVSSWQSRDEAAEKYGGAIRFYDNIIFSFSGFSEHEDEDVCITLAQQLGMHDSAVTKIIDASRNMVRESFRRHFET